MSFVDLKKGSASIFGKLLCEAVQQHHVQFVVVVGDLLTYIPIHDREWIARFKASHHKFLFFFCYFDMSFVFKSRHTNLAHSIFSIEGRYGQFMSKKSNQPFSCIERTFEMKCEEESRFFSWITKGASPYRFARHRKQFCVYYVYGERIWCYASTAK